MVQTIDDAVVGLVNKATYPKGTLERVPGKQNWVDRAGGLPRMIERIAGHLHYEKGMTIGHAIAVAVNAVKKGCATGDVNWPGRQSMNPASRAAYCKAVAQWESKKARARVSKGIRGRKLTDSEYIAMIEKRFFSAERRRKLAGKGKALPGGRFPIEKPQDVTNAVRLFHHAPTASVKAHIIRRARAIGATDRLPDDWQISKQEENAAVALVLGKHGGSSHDQLSHGFWSDKSKRRRGTVRAGSPRRKDILASANLKEVGPNGQKRDYDFFRHGDKSYVYVFGTKKLISVGNAAEDVTGERIDRILRQGKKSLKKNVEFDIKGKIKKIDEDQGLIFGWASVAVTKDGETVVDKQGDILDDIDAMEAVAYDFVLKSRDGGEMHVRKGVSTLVESFVTTPEKIKKMGLQEGDLPIGWWVGFKFNDMETFSKIKDGKYKQFSVHGSGVRKELEDA